MVLAEVALPVALPVAAARLQEAAGLAQVREAAASLVGVDLHLALDEAVLPALVGADLPGRDVVSAAVEVGLPVVRREDEVASVAQPLAEEAVSAVRPLRVAVAASAGVDEGRLVASAEEAALLVLVEGSVEAVSEGEADRGAAHSASSAAVVRRHEDAGASGAAVVAVAAAVAAAAVGRKRPARGARAKTAGPCGIVTSVACTGIAILASATPAVTPLRRCPLTSGAVLR